MAALAPFFGWAAALLAVDVGLYALLALGVAAETVARTRRGSDGWLAAMIPWMHLAYGLAEWKEFFRPGADFSEKKG